MAKYFEVEVLYSVYNSESIIEPNNQLHSVYIDANNNIFANVDIQINTDHGSHVYKREEEIIIYCNWNGSIDTNQCKLFTFMLKSYLAAYNTSYLWRENDKFVENLFINTNQFVITETPAF